MRRKVSGPATPYLSLKHRSLLLDTNSRQPQTTTNHFSLLKVDTFELANASRQQHLGCIEYAILSHTWREDGDEVSFQDVRPHSLEAAMEKSAFQKIQQTSRQAKRDGLDYFWVDTCCIDKTSSAELTEAINSMSQWYASARVCYVYMSDVDEAEGEESFRRSRWFTRAWTLQELLAPKEVRFYDESWRFIGRLSDPIWAKIVSEVTGIDVRMLLHTAKLQDFSIAQRMSWAAYRKATRLEDHAYSLLGIFDVTMPLLYGEGHKSFIRLQQEILKMSTDDSIFCWELPTGLLDTNGGSENRALLARSPSFFAGFGNIISKPDRALRPYQMTNRGLEITLPIRSYWTEQGGCKLTSAKLNCGFQEAPDQTIVLNLQQQFDLDADKSNPFKHWLRRYQRRRRELWDNFVGRDFDWHFVASYARRGFAVGHSAGGGRLRMTVESRRDFREQTIVILRQPLTSEFMCNSQVSRSANPVAKFNELQWITGLFILLLETFSMAMFIVWDDYNLVVEDRDVETDV